MSALDKAILTLTADADGDGSDETGEFHMKDNLVITSSVRTGFVIGGRGSTINSIIESIAGDGDNLREGFYLDLGGGQDVVQLQFEQPNGSSNQWGNNSSAALSQTSATGQDPQSQISVIKNYLNAGTYDSRSPATLEYGEFHSSGVYSSLDVVLESPEFSYAVDESHMSGTITCISAQTLADVVEVGQQPDAQ